MSDTSRRTRTPAKTRWKWAHAGPARRPGKSRSSIPIERLRRPARDEHHRCRTPHVGRGHRRRQDGNGRTPDRQDGLGNRAALYRSNGYAVRHVMNITDVGHLTSDADTGEDKMEMGARRTGKTAWEIAQLYTDRTVTPSGT